MDTDVRPTESSHAPRRGVPRLAAATLLLLAVAAGLRLWRVAWGLPDAYEEALPVHVALRMIAPDGGGIDPNPHFFNYPSLGIELHLAVQLLVMHAGRLLGAWAGPADYRLAFALDPSPMLLAARGLSIAADVLAVLALVRLGERAVRGAGLLAGALLAFAPLAIVTSRSVFVDTLMAALALWSLERALAWRAEGGAARLVAAAVLAGLAAGCKYPAAVLLVPIGWLAWRREGPRGFVTAFGVALLAGAAFLVTTPWAVLDRAAFARDFTFEGAHAAAGHLGSLGRRALAFHAANLWRNLGPVVLVAAAAALVLTWPRRSGAARDGDTGSIAAATVALALAFAGFGLPIAFARIEAERYLLPVLGVAAALAGIGTAALLRSRASSPAARVFAASVLLGWPIAHGARAAYEGAGHTQTLARAFLERTFAPATLVVTEGYGPLLPTASRLDAVRGGPVYRHASPPWRERFDGVRPWNVVALPLGVSGALTNPVTPPGGETRTLVVAAHGSALNEVFYEPALFAEADVLVTSSAVRARHLSDAARFPRAVALYRILEREAPVVARFGPGGGVIGPEIVVHRLDERARRALAAGGALDPAWWTAAVPHAYRREASALLGAGAADPLAARDPGGAPAAWVASLRPLYHGRIAAFVLDMASAHERAGRDSAAVRFAEANLRVAAEDVPACRIAAASLRRLGRPAEARRHFERAFAAGGSEVDAGLALEYARCLRLLGEEARARAIFRQLADTLPGDDPVGSAARTELAPGAGG